MKIAISVKENTVSEHFGHSDGYAIFSLNEKGAIIENEFLTATGESCGCRSNIAEVLREKGVKVLLAGNMGNGAYLNMNHAGLRVYRGCSGSPRQLAEDYIQGKVIDSGLACSHHSHSNHHECSH